MKLIFTTIKDAIRLKLYLTANGLRAILVKDQDQFMYSFNSIHMKRNQYAKALIYFIKEIKRNEWLNNQLLHKYHYENEDERSHIIEITSQMLSGVRQDLSELAGSINEYDLVKPAVEDLLSFPGTISFDSFSRFRLKSYYEQVGRYLEVAIDEYKMEQEYQMFINMLRDYLKNRDPRKSTIHLRMDDSLQFFDEHIQEVGNHEIKEIMDQRLLANHPIYVDSAVIAPLLSMAPQKIYVYTNEDDQPLVRTLCNIFEERIAILSPVHLYALEKAYVKKP